LTSRLSATAGVRYTNEGKDIDNAGGRYALAAPNLAVPGSTYGYSDSITHSAWTPKVGLELKLPKGTLSYVSATRGFKSGGFNSRAASAATIGPFAPEKARAFEVGLKSDWYDNRLRVNVAAFWNKYEDLQVSVFRPASVGTGEEQVVANNANERARGVEVEVTAIELGCLGVKRQRPSQLKLRLDRGDDLFVLDVREPHEYQICNIGGHLIPLGDLPRRVNELDTSKEIVAHCRSGVRSAKAVNFLRQAGFKKVHNLAGGILAWADRVDPNMPKY